MLNNIKKAAAVILTICITICFAGCSDGVTNIFNFSADTSSQAEEDVTPLSSLTLPADTTDSFNPFEATTVANRYIFPLMYDSLFKLNEHFAAKKCLADKYSLDGKQLSIKIKSDVKFSDGTLMTADDVAYSIKKAMSSPLYSDQLSNISEIVNDSETVKITLKQYDCNFINCLDTPIVKSGTADSSSSPTGSGRYTLNKKNGVYTLKYYKNYFIKGKPNFKKITLSMVPDSEAIMTSIKTGQVDAMFSDLRDGEIGGTYTNTVSVSLNNMIYIGVNSNKRLLSSSSARRAISFALNRSVILSKSYSSRGTATYLPINPLYDTGTNVKVPSYSTKKATQLLEKLGYTSTNSSGIRIKNRKAFTLKLLINSDNAYKELIASAVKSALQTVGIEIKIVRAKSISALTSKIKSGDFDLYIGETRLTNNMNISDFFSSSVLSKGISEKSKLSSAYKKYLKTADITAFSKTFFNEMPFIPLLFRSGIVAYNGNITTEPVCTPTDIYSNIFDWK